MKESTPPAIVTHAKRLVLEVEAAVDAFPHKRKFGLGQEIRDLAYGGRRRVDRRLGWRMLRLLPQKTGAGIGVLICGSDELPVFRRAAFFVSGCASMDGRTGEPQGSLVPHQYANPVRSSTTIGVVEDGSQLEPEFPMRQHPTASIAPIVIPFSFRDHSVRAFVRDGEPWFVCTDVAQALGYRDAANAARNLADRQKGTQIVSTPSGEQLMTIINESGLYRLVLRSRKPEAVAFSDWVTGEVLPTIRKTGGYGAPSGELLSTEYRRDSHEFALRYFDACRSMLPAGAKPPAFDFRPDPRIADGLIAEMLMSGRWLISFDHEFKPRISSVSRDASIVNLHDPKELASRIRESMNDAELMTLMRSLFDCVEECMPNVRRQRAARSAQ